MLSWPFRPYPFGAKRPLAKSGRPVLIEKTFRKTLGERASILPKCPNSRARLLPRAAILGADYRGGRAGLKSSLRGTYNLIPDFTYVVIDYNDGHAYIAP
jgi:hypothetical protein